MVQIISLLWLYTQTLHTVSCFSLPYFIGKSEQLILSGCYHWSCPQPRIITRYPSIFCGITNYQVCAVCGNPPPDYPSLFFSWPNGFNVVNIGPEACCKFSLLSDILLPCQARWIFRIPWKINMDVSLPRGVITVRIISPNKLLRPFHALCGKIWWGFDTHHTSALSFPVHWCIWWINICQIRSTIGTKANRKMEIKKFS